MEDEATRGTDELTLRDGHEGGPAAKARGGRVLGGRYRIQAMLGAGGMGSVFLAFDEELGERVAVKMLKPELVADEVMLDRFRSEVRLARRVTHRNVARTYDIGEDGVDRFLTMEFIDGESLFDRLRRTGPLAFDFLLAVADGIATGLAAAHEAGVVHRDLKPQNVMLARDGRVVLTDFGIALGRGERGANDLAGTPAYMAPEQLTGEAVDERADVFALGVVLYRVATGRPPFGAPFGAGSPPPDPRGRRPALPPAFGEIVRRCLEREPSRRYANAAEVKRALGTVPVVVEEAPLTMPGSLSLVRHLDVTGSRLVAVRSVTAPGELDTIAKWLAGAMAEALGENPLLRTALDDGPDAEVAVECALEGAAERLRAVVGLRTVRDGRTFWEGDVGVATVDIASLPAAIAHAVEAALAVDVPADPDLPPLPKACVAPYVRARMALSSAFGDGIGDAVRLLTGALAEAPDHPLLVSAAAHALARESFWNGGRLEEARAVAERAVTLAPRRAESHLALANVGWQFGDPLAMAPALRAALAIAPGHALARHLLAQVLLEAGAAGDAARLLDDVLVRAPQLQKARIDLAHGYALRGLYDRAERMLDDIPVASPERATSIVWRCRHALWRRDVVTARRLLDGVDGEATHVVRAMTELYRCVLDGAPSRLLPENAVMSVPTDAVPRRRAIVAQFCAEADAYGAFWDDVLANLERAVEAGLQDAFWIDRCPVLDEIRGSRRFEALRSVVRSRALAAFAALDDLDAT